MTNASVRDPYDPLELGAVAWVKLLLASCAWSRLTGTVGCPYRCPCGHVAWHGIGSDRFINMRTQDRLTHPFGSPAGDLHNVGWSMTADRASSALVSLGRLDGTTDSLFLTIRMRITTTDLCLLFDLAHEDGLSSAGINPLLPTATRTYPIQVF